MEPEPDPQVATADAPLEVLLAAVEASDAVDAAEPALELARALERELDRE